MRLLSALQEFATFPRDLSLATSSQECDPELVLRKLAVAVVQLKEQSVATQAPDAAKIEQLVVRCRMANYQLQDFEPREIRLMSWNNELLLNPEFRSQLAARVRSNTVKPNLLVLSQVYFGNWGQHRQPEIFEQMLRILAIAQGGFTPLLQRYKEEAHSIFSETAHSFLSRLVRTEKRPVLAILETWAVPVTSPLASESIRTYIERAVPDIVRGQSELLDDLLTTLSLPVLKGAVFQKAAETLILCEQADRNEKFRRSVQEFVLDSSRLGDPRLPQNVPNWNGIDAAALHKFRTWRATKDLVFFFNTVMPDGRDPHGRKDFWLQYVDKVVDSVVALCPTDLQRLRVSLSAEKVHHCRILDNEQVSCFLMRFRTTNEDIIVAEFSNVGRARIFYYRRFLEGVGDMNRSEFRLKELRTEDGLAAGFVHRGPWQAKVRNTLARLGVRLR